MVGGGLMNGLLIRNSGWEFVVDEWLMNRWFMVDGGLMNGLLIRKINDES